MGGVFRTQSLEPERPEHWQGGGRRADAVQSGGEYGNPDPRCVE